MFGRVLCMHCLELLLYWIVDQKLIHLDPHYLQATVDMTNPAFPVDVSGLAGIFQKSTEVLFKILECRTSYKDLDRIKSFSLTRILRMIDYGICKLFM